MKQNNNQACSGAFSRGPTLNRRLLLQAALPLMAAPLLFGCSRPVPPTGAAPADALVPSGRPDEFWRDKLSPAAYAVLFDDDTEPAFSSALNLDSSVSHSARRPEPAWNWAARPVFGRR
jgi:hypothetical protein